MADMLPAFVTFNYDRSLEHFFRTALAKMRVQLTVEGWWLRRVSLLACLSHFGNRFMVVEVGPEHEEHGRSR